MKRAAIQRQKEPELGQLVESLLNELARVKAELHRRDEQGEAPQQPGDGEWVLPADTILGVAAHLQAARRARAQHLPASLFGEPAWDLLLGLSAAAFTGRNLSKSEACSLAGAPRSTAARWLDTLEKCGLVERAPTAEGDVRVLVRLSAEGRRRMVDTLSDMADRLQHLR